MRKTSDNGMELENSLDVWKYMEEEERSIRRERLAEAVREGVARSCEEKRRYQLARLVTEVL